jgi:hypothetical protein
LICLRRRRSTQLDLHHLRHDHLGHEPWWNYGRSTRGRVRSIVTAASRALRPGVSIAASTYLVWFVARLPPVIGVAALAGLTSVDKDQLTKESLSNKRPGG